MTDYAKTVAEIRAKHCSGACAPIGTIQWDITTLCGIVEAQARERDEARAECVVLHAEADRFLAYLRRTYRWGPNAGEVDARIGAFEKAIASTTIGRDEAARIRGLEADSKELYSACSCRWEVFEPDGDIGDQIKWCMPHRQEAARVRALEDAVERFAQMHEASSQSKGSPLQVDLSDLQRTVNDALACGRADAEVEFESQLRETRAECAKAYNLIELASGTMHELPIDEAIREYMDNTNTVGRTEAARVRALETEVEVLRILIGQNRERELALEEAARELCEAIQIDGTMILTHEIAGAARDKLRALLAKGRTGEVGS